MSNDPIRPWAIDRGDIFTILDDTPGVTGGPRMRVFGPRGVTHVGLDISEIMTLHEFCTKVMAREAGHALAAEGGAPAPGGVDTAAPDGGWIPGKPPFPFRSGG